MTENHMAASSADGECITKRDGSIKHTTECNVRHDAEMVSKVARDTFTGPAKQRVIRQRARQRARARRRVA